MVADPCAVKDSGAHTDEDIVPHGAAVDDGAVADGAAPAHHGLLVEHGAVLILVSSPTVMAPSSPRSTALYQMLTPLPRVTSPTTTGTGADQQIFIRSLFLFVIH